jgi:hypothetical protein
MITRPAKPRLFQIASIKTFSESAIDRSKKLVGRPLASFAPEPLHLLSSTRAPSDYLGTPRTLAHTTKMTTQTPDTARGSAQVVIAIAAPSLIPFRFLVDVVLC